MKPVIVRNVTIGTEQPKICVPIVGITKEEIINAVTLLLQVPVDVVEWRVDWYEDVFDVEKVKDVAKSIRERLGEIPLLFTFRTAKEGGEKEIGVEEYVALNTAMAQSGYVDLIDVEAFFDEKAVPVLIECAHKAGVKVVASNHDFDKTPEQEEIVSRLQYMQSLDADLPKIAVMPKSKKDVITLLAATEEMSTNYADRPIITMSMASDGVISRMCGEVFGSALTFGAVGKVSAPGQMKVEDLKTMLSLLHESL